MARRNSSQRVGMPAGFAERNYSSNWGDGSRQQDRSYVVRSNGPRLVKGKWTYGGGSSNETSKS